MAHSIETCSFSISSGTGELFTPIMRQCYIYKTKCYSTVSFQIFQFGALIQILIDKKLPGVSVRGDLVY